MSAIDPIADMLTRVRNGLHARKRDVSMPVSKIKVGIAEILKQEGYVSDFSVTTEEGFGTLTLLLKYGRRGERVIRSITRVSKPGRRVYARATDIPEVINGIGISIISTSQGLMTNRDAKAKRVGGEIICEVY